MLTTYIVASLALIVKPGPDLMCLLATALSESRPRAFALMLGQMTGCWLWVMLLALGVASLLADCPAVMTAIQIVGILYIAYLAVMSLKECRDGLRGESAAAASDVPQAGKFFRRGVAMAASNPLTILFFLAFLPQFMREDSSWSPAMQTIALGTIFCLLVPLFDIPFVLAAGFFRARLSGTAKLPAVLKGISGLILAAVVVLLVLRCL